MTSRLCETANETWAVPRELDTEHDAGWVFSHGGARDLGSLGWKRQVQECQERIERQAWLGDVSSRDLQPESMHRGVVRFGHRRKQKSELRMSRD